MTNEIYSKSLRARRRNKDDFKLTPFPSEYSHYLFRCPISPFYSIDALNDFGLEEELLIIYNYNGLLIWGEEE